MNTDSYRNYSGVFPNPDAVQEFSVQKSNFSAEYANATGGVVAVATKSGTNQFHGSAFEFLRNGVFNARNFFAARRDSLKRSQFGGTLGGPVLKDRLFFFTAYQGTRTRSDPALTRQYLPTAAMRRGDFSAVGRALTDPQTRAPFPGNQIPASRLNPVTLALLKYIPDPGTADGQRFVSVPLKTGEDEFTAKVDANLGAHRLMTRYFRQRFGRPFTGKTDDLASMYASDVGISSQPYNQLTVSDIATLSSRIINSATAALRWRRTFNDWSSVKLPIDFAQAGVKGIAVKAPASLYVNVSGGFLARPGLELRQDRLRRPHLRYGDVDGGQPRAEVRRRVPAHQERDQERLPHHGAVQLHRQTSPQRLCRLHAGGDIPVRPGGRRVQEALRHPHRFLRAGRLAREPEPHPDARAALGPHAAYHDDLGRTQCFVPGATSKRFPNAPAGYLNEGDPGCPTGGIENYWAQLAPRFGFAWRMPDGGTVVRGGFGLFWDPQYTALYNGFVNAAPFSPQVTRYGVRFEDPYGTAANPFPASFAPFQPPPDAAFFLPLGTVGVFSQGFRPSYMETFNVTLEREIARNLAVRASYIGNMGRHLSYTDTQNYAVYAPGASAGNIQQRRPYQNFGNILTVRSEGTSSYHGLQLSVERRMAHNLSFEVNYTFAKAIDDASTDTNPQNVSQVIPANRKLNRGVSDFDIKHRLVGVLCLGAAGAEAARGIGRAVLGGWQLSGIASMRSGHPFSVTSGTDRAFSASGGRSRMSSATRRCRAAARAPSKSRSISTRRPSRSPRSEPSAPRRATMLRGPSNVNFDLGLMKMFSLTEKLRLQFRAELFNAFNTPHFNSPFASTNTPSRLGRIEGAGDPRIVQFALKLSF